MKKTLALLALGIFANKSFAEDCAASPARIKFSCIHYSLFTNKNTKMIVTLPAGSKCMIPPFSGKIYIPESKKEWVIYSPSVTFKFLAKDLSFAEITYKSAPDSEKETELLCREYKVYK